MRRISIVVVVVLVLSSGAGLALAQEGTSTPGDEQASPTTTQTPTTTPTATPTETPEPTETTTESDESDDGLNVSSDDIWKVFRDSKEKTNANDKEIIATLGPGAWVTDFQLNEEEEIAMVTITQKTTHAYTFSDTNSANRSKKVSYISHRQEQIPRGTYTVIVPATVAKDGNQQICITGNDKWPCLGNGEVRNDSVFDDLVSLKVAIGAILMFLIGIVARVGWKVYRAQENGLPETMDGTVIDKARVGVKEDE